MIARSRRSQRAHSASPFDEIEKAASRNAYSLNIDIASLLAPCRSIWSDLQHALVDPADVWFSTGLLL
jgi:hypothetical protein